jgi:hypothetical protein
METTYHCRHHMALACADSRPPDPQDMPEPEIFRKLDCALPVVNYAARTGRLPLLRIWLGED